jgi:hypothetical protein
MTTPTLPFMMDIVKVMASILQDGHQKVGRCPLTFFLREQGDDTLF